MKKALSCLMIAVMLCLSCSCNASPNSETSAASSEVTSSPVVIVAQAASKAASADHEISADINFSNLQDFSYETASTLLMEQKGNLHFSPLSFYYASALAAIGAEGSTRDELFALLGVDSKEQLMQQCKELSKLCGKSDLYEVQWANSVWMQKDRVFSESFKQNAVDYFNASLYNVDFQAPQTKDAMEEWITEQLKGNITPIFDITPETAMDIINCLYFAARWEDNGGLDSEEQTFYIDNENTLQNTFIGKTLELHTIYESNQYRRTTVKFTDRDCNIEFVLPNDGVSLDSLMTSPQSLENLFTKGTKTKYDEVIFKMPVFSFSNDFDLIKLAQSLGVTSAFNWSSADFSGISSNSPLVISTSKQQTFIEATEYGVTAAALSMQICSTGIPEEKQLKTKSEFILDHPFLYAIKSDDGTILFIGRCNNPSQH